jgi:hypothetical protein
VVIVVVVFVVVVVVVVVIIIVVVVVALVVALRCRVRPTASSGPCACCVHERWNCVLCRLFRDIECVVALLRSGLSH